MALHKPPIDIPFVDLKTGLVTPQWAKWLLIAKRDKANRVEGGTENNIVTLDSDGHPKDAGKTMTHTHAHLSVIDNNDGTLTIEVAGAHPYIRYSDLTATKDGSSLTINVEDVETYIIY